MSRSSLCLLPALLLLPACGSDAPPAADVAAEVSGRAIPYAEFEAYLAANAMGDAPSLDGLVLSGLFDQFLGEMLVDRLAKDEVPDADRASAVSTLVSRTADDVTEEQIQSFYKANQSRFRQPERVRLRQILVEDRSKAEQALSELARGRPFDEVARGYSEGPRAEMGGEQGLLSRDDLPPELATQIFALELLEVSEIVVADYGFHIFQVYERFSAEEVPVEVARIEVVEALQERGRTQALGRLVSNAAERYNVRVFDRNLPFQYQGRYQNRNRN